MADSPGRPRILKGDMAFLGECFKEGLRLNQAGDPCRSHDGDWWEGARVLDSGDHDLSGGVSTRLPLGSHVVTAPAIAVRIAEERDLQIATGPQSLG
jgi:hypothetical protein